jgi:hypothetical protein
LALLRPAERYHAAKTSVFTGLLKFGETFFAFVEMEILVLTDRFDQHKRGCVAPRTGRPEWTRTIDLFRVKEAL